MVGIAGGCLASFYHCQPRTREGNVFTLLSICSQGVLIPQYTRTCRREGGPSFRAEGSDGKEGSIKAKSGRTG